MPQFDPSTFSSQIFWLLVSGLALILFVRFVLIPRVNIIFQNRKNFLDQEQQSIHALEEQLNNIKTKRQEEVQIAEKKAHDFLLSVKKDLEIEKKQHIDLLEKKMNDKIVSFETELSQKSATAKEEYAKNLDSYLSIVQQDVISDGGYYVK